MIRGSFIVGCVIVLMLAVAPNFAQDYGLVDGSNADSTSASATPSISGAQSDNRAITPTQLRQMLGEALSDQSPRAAGDNASLPATTPVYNGVSYDQALINDWQQSRTNELGKQLARMVRKFPDYPEDFVEAMARATSPETGLTTIWVVLVILLTAIVGLLVERFTIRKLLTRLYAYVESQPRTTSVKIKFIFTRAIIQLVGVAVMAVVTYAAIIWFRNDNPFFEMLFVQNIGALLMLRLWMILLRNIFSPSRPSLRPIPLDDQSSIRLYRWFVMFFIIIEFGGAFFTYLTRAGFSEALLNGLLIPYTLSLNLIILTQVWSMRRRITGMFISEQEDVSDQGNGFARDFFSSAWPFVFTAWLLLLWMLWLYKAFLGNWQEAGYISISWWITLAFFVADRIFYGLVRNVVDIGWLHSPTYHARSSRFIRITLNGFRLLMVTVAVYMFSLAWGLAPGMLIDGGVTNKILSHGINLLVIATITYIIWEFFNALIERQLPEESDALASLEGEGGGAGATRAETLLPLMRTLLTVMLITFVMLSVLHSFGIAITPLLAGAGVVGIAIGFGAQKLVQDVLSGIFFLIDDAFRKSEYIEIEELRGTVEKISLRSMQLRHHLGAVQTIPYGEIKTVKNLSRDWVTMKLELRLSYDTDIEQVRKIIKKVGQEMLQDEEMGPSFILPLKSQGVMRVEESALIVRMKFTTKPGEQWVIRREAYRQVRDALAEGGIFFAHREVRVRLPDDQLGAQTPENKDAIRDTLEKAGAAASAEAEDAGKRSKIDYDNEM